MSVSPVSLKEFVSTVVELARDGFDPEPMTRLLTETRVRGDDLARYIVRGEEAEYTRTLVHRTDDVEILAMTWPKGSGTPIHDHGGQRCWMVAASGLFIMEEFRRVSGGRTPGHAVVERVGEATSLVVGKPDFRHGPDHDIHRVLVAPDCELAVSLNVYARPYSACLVFDEHEKTAREIHLAAQAAPF